MPPRMRLILREVFGELKEAVDNGTLVELDVYRNKTLEVVTGEVLERVRLILGSTTMFLADFQYYVNQMNTTDILTEFLIG